MKYDDTVERSTELLRMALPMMSKQGSPLHPVSYAVWYEYFGKRNLALRQAVDAHLHRNGALDDSATLEVFRKHVAEINPDDAQRVADGFQRVLEGMADSADQVSRESTRFGSSLEQLGEVLTEDGNAVVEDALAATRKMQQAMSRLQQRLEDSQREITTLRSEVQRARHESLVDILTGLPNRRAFDQQLVTAMAAAEADPNGPPPCLVMADIDHFKRINDNFGHPFGDQVLKAVAQVLRKTVGDAALAARTGGEEFSVLIHAGGVEQAAALAEAIRSTVAASRIRRKGADETIETVTISLGVARFRAGEAANDFIDRADQALYASKHDGRNRVTVNPD